MSQRRLAVWEAEPLGDGLPREGTRGEIVREDPAGEVVFVPVDLLGRSVGRRGYADTRDDVREVDSATGKAGEAVRGLVRSSIDEHEAWREWWSSEKGQPMALSATINPLEAAYQALKAVLEALEEYARQEGAGTEG